MICDAFVHLEFRKEKAKYQLYMILRLASSGDNGKVEYYEEFPIRLIHQFEGNVFMIY